MSRVTRPRPTIGTPLYAIAKHWLTRDELPDAKIRTLGLDKPSCFRCGWIPPTANTNQLRADHPNWTAERALRETWRRAGRFLDRAHLVDWMATQDDSPDNLVPLCHYPCHDEMPDYGNGDYGNGGRAEALAWIAAGREQSALWRDVWQTVSATLAIEYIKDRHDLKHFYVKALEFVAHRQEVTANTTP